MNYDNWNDLRGAAFKIAAARLAEKKKAQTTKVETPDGCPDASQTTKCVRFVSDGADSTKKGFSNNTKTNSSVRKTKKVTRAVPVDRISATMARKKRRFRARIAAKHELYKDRAERGDRDDARPAILGTSVERLAKQLEAWIRPVHPEEEIPPELYEALAKSMFRNGRHLLTERFPLATFSMCVEDTIRCNPDSCAHMVHTICRTWDKILDGHHGNMKEMTLSTLRWLHKKRGTVQQR